MTNNKEFEVLIKSISENKYTEEVLELSESGITDQQAQILAVELKKILILKLSI
jgi:hypothetical protein